jgi:hypothetical protein
MTGSLRIYGDGILRRFCGNALTSGDPEKIHAEVGAKIGR